MAWASAVRRSAAQRFRIIDAFGRIVGIENHRGDATGPASGPRPTSSTPATDRAALGETLALEGEIGRAHRSADRAVAEPGEVEGGDFAQQLDERIRAVLGAGFALGRPSRWRRRQPRPTGSSRSPSSRSRSAGSRANA